MAPRRLRFGNACRRFRRSSVSLQLGYHNDGSLERHVKKVSVNVMSTYRRDVAVRLKLHGLNNPRNVNTESLFTERIVVSLSAFIKHDIQEPAPLHQLK